MASRSYLLRLLSTVMLLFPYSTAAYFRDPYHKSVFPNAYVPLLLENCLPSHLKDEPIMNQQPRRRSELPDSGGPWSSWEDPSPSQASGVAFLRANDSVPYDNRTTLSWTLEALVPLSANVSWVASEWEVPMTDDFSLLSNRSALALTRLHEMATQPAENKASHQRLAFSNSIHVEAVGVMWRAENEGGTSFKLCLLGVPTDFAAGYLSEQSYQLEDAPKGRKPFSLRFDLQYTPPIGTIHSSTMGWDNQPFTWEGEVTAALKDSNDAVDIPAIGIRGKSYSSLDAYVFQEEMNTTAYCLDVPQRKTGWLQSLLGWRFPRAVGRSGLTLVAIGGMQTSGVLEDTDKLQVAGRHGAWDFESYGANMDESDVYFMSPVCDEQESGFSTLQHAGFSGLYMAALSAGGSNASLHCLSNSLWFKPQLWANGTTVRGPGTRGSSSERAPTGTPTRVALEMTAWLPSVNGQTVKYTVNLEGTYNRDVGQLCLRGCRFRSRHSMRYDMPTTARGSDGVGGGALQEDALHEEPDCDLLVTVLLPRHYPWPLLTWRAPISGSIRSLRSPGEPLHFPEIALGSRGQFLTDEESRELYERTEAKLAGGLLMASLIAICLYRQLRYLQSCKEEFQYLSLATVASYCLGLGLVIVSSLLQDLSDYGGTVLWSRFSSSAPFSSPVQAALAACCCLSGYLVYRVLQARRQRGWSWKGHGPQTQPEDVEMPLLATAGEGRAPLAPAETSDGLKPGRKFWGPQSSHLLCLPAYILAGLYSLWQLVGRQAATSDVEMLSTGTPSQFDFFLQRAQAIVGILGSLLQDLFLLPQVIHLATLERVAAPLHPWFAYGLSAARLGAHLLEPHASQPGGVVVVLLCVYYFLVGDFLVLMARRVQGTQE